MKKISETIAQQKKADLRFSAPMKADLDHTSLSAFFVYWTGVGDDNETIP